MKVLVYGGRQYHDRARVFAELTALHAEMPIAVIIEGGAKGADRHARQWANSHAIAVETFEAAWDDLQAEVVQPRRRPDGSYYNAAAGNTRNLLMMTRGKPDVAMEFPGKAGTASMRRIVHTEMKRRPLRHIVIQG